MEESNESILLLNFDGGLFSNIQEFVVAEENLNGRKVVRVGCEGGLNSCLPKQLIDKKSKESVCKTCIHNQIKIKTPNMSINFRKTSQNLLSLPEEVQNLLYKYQFISSEIREYKYRGVPIFRLVGFDLIMNTRTLKLDRKLNEFPPEIAVDIYHRLEDVCQLIDWAYLSIPFEKFSYILACNGNYMINGIFREICQINKIPFYSIEMEPFTNSGYIKYKYIPDRISLNSSHRSVDNYLGYKHKIRNFKSVLKQFENRFNGNAHNAYTNLESDLQLVEKLNIFKQSHESIRSIFLSSTEELLAHQYAFGNIEEYSEQISVQLNFLEFILKESNKYPKVGTIIRIHPRQGVSKKSKTESEEYQLIKKLLSEHRTPDNVLVILAHENISSHKIMARSDIICVFWSTVAIESLLLAYPTITLAPEVKVWPISALTTGQYSTSTEARANYFSIDSQMGLPLDNQIIFWFERTFAGNWYSTCIPIFTNTSLVYPKYFTWRVIDKLKLRNLIYELWLRLTDKSKIRNFYYSKIEAEASRNKISIILSKLMLARWRQNWGTILKGESSYNS